MGYAFQNTRAKGTGQIRRSRWPKHGYDVHAPGSHGKHGAFLGHFDTYRDAERALAAYLERDKVA